MLRVKNASLAAFPFAVLPACSLIIDTNPDGLLTSNVAGKRATDSGEVATTNGGSAPTTSSKLNVTSRGGSASSANTTAATSSGAAANGSSGLGIGSTITGSTVENGGTTAVGGTAASSATNETAVGGLGPGPKGGTTATDGTVTGGATATGGTTTAATCTDEGCACTGTATIPCNDCGTRACNASTKRWGACTASQSPAATQCASATTLQTCSSDGKWVSSACPNSDATNCSVGCVASATSSACKVSAKDADGDTHYSAKCTAAPGGDDCDDTNKSVYPGAEEVCDGVDNDCDGKADLKDGLSLSGGLSVEPYIVQSLAWSPSSQKFGAISIDGHFGTLARTTVTTHATVWNSSRAIVGSGSGLRGEIAWAPTRGTFILAFAFSKTYVYDVDVLGNVSGGYELEGSAPVSLAARSSGEMLYVRGGADYSFVDRYTGSTPSTAFSINEIHTSAQIATSGDQAAVIFWETGEVIKWYRITAALGALERVQLSTAAARGHDIATVSNGYAVAWGTASGFDYQVMSVSGTIVCGPTHVSSASVRELAIASTQYGTLVLTDEVRLLRFDNACNLLDSILVDNVSYGLPRIAMGGGYVAMAWQDESTYGKTRIVGERLCN